MRVRCYMVTSTTPISAFFFFNDTATTEIYTLSLHDALPICQAVDAVVQVGTKAPLVGILAQPAVGGADQREIDRSEEHTSELQSPCNLVCRLLLEKKKLTTSHRPRCPGTSPTRTAASEAPAA